MPLFVVRKLSLGELTPTTVTLQMADRTMVKLEGVIEDVLVKVGKFFFLSTLSSWILKKIHKSLCC